MPCEAGKSSRMRALVIMPRSPISTTSERPNCWRNLLTLGGDGLGIGGVAGKYFDRDRASGSVSEQAKDDLQLTGLVVPRVTEFGQRTVAAFEVSGSQVIKH